jgi:cell wall-associated NlpC family hydrolase
MGLVRLAVVLLCVVLGAGCASSGAVPRPFPGGRGTPGTADTPEPTDAPDARAPGGVDASLLVQTALGLRGVPYRSGGTDPKGFDCSGLVQYVFSRHGVSLPREVREQVQLGREVRLAGIEPGDLIFFAIASQEASHVGMAIGGDGFVHAPSGRGVVRVEKFSAPYWARRIVAVRRVRGN